VLGVGINVNASADELPTWTDTPAGSLSLASGRAVSRAELLAELLVRLERRYDAWAAGAR
jgi:biotin-(acetyl-CoA carboxylase) ligase